MEFKKENVYTALNADELKAGDSVIVADDLVYLKTLVERGLALSTIKEIYDGNYQRRFTVAGDNYAYNLAYLVERVGEKKFRPYKDTDEMIADYKKRFSVDCPEYEIPSIWVKNKSSLLRSQITDFNTDYIWLSNIQVFFRSLFDDYTYLDGSPCGMEE